MKHREPLRFARTDNDLDARLSSYKRYGKLQGWRRALRLNLPVSSIGFVCASDGLSGLRLPPDTVFLCRPDAPIGAGLRLPRGRDLTPGQIPSFLSELQTLERKSVVLAFIHPSIEFTGGYLPRYRTAGAATIVRLKEYWLIEYVGPGYDVGDLTRGVAVHASLSIAPSILAERPSTVLKYARFLPGSFAQIKQSDYSSCRQQRIRTLTRDLRETEAVAIAAAIPETPPRLTLPLLRSLQQIIWDLAYPEDGEPLSFYSTVLLNIYPGRAFHVFEIWEPRRSKHRA